MTSGSPAPIEVRALSADDGATLLELDQWAFGFDSVGDDPAAVLARFEWDRVYGAMLDGALAGVHATHSLQLSVPGGWVPAAGLTWVGVHPQYRRRGVLNAMMTRHLQAAAQRGEPVSALFAAEMAIYGRYGYGHATRATSLTLPRRAALRPVDGARPVTVRFDKADAERHAALVDAVYQAAGEAVPGTVTRPSEALRNSPFDVRPTEKAGAEQLRILIAERPGPDGEGEPVGYALFARKQSWSETGPDGQVRVKEMRATDPAAAAAIWGRLLDLDLTSVVQSGARPTDDVLLQLLVDPVRAAPRLRDGLWVRIVDLPAALTARRYGQPLDVVLEVSDELLGGNAGRWRLVADADAVSCMAVDAPADLRLDVRDLGAAYLGGVTLNAMAAAGLVHELVEGSLAPAAAAFASTRAPFSGWVF